MSTMLINSRHKAYKSQSGYCIYCFKPMWVENPDEFVIKYKITKRQAKFYQCTAEHLLPRQDGGKDSINNIAAACKFCNQQRHKSKLALPPVKYQEYVQSKVAKNRWPTSSFLQEY